MISTAEVDLVVNHLRLLATEPLAPSLLHQVDRTQIDMVDQHWGGNEFVRINRSDTSVLLNLVSFRRLLSDRFRVSVSTTSDSLHMSFSLRSRSIWTDKWNRWRSRQVFPPPHKCTKIMLLEWLVCRRLSSHHQPHYDGRRRRSTKRETGVGALKKWGAIELYACFSPILVVSCVWTPPLCFVGWPSLRTKPVSPIPQTENTHPSCWSAV